MGVKRNRIEIIVLEIGPPVVWVCSVEELCTVLCVLAGAGSSKDIAG